jgi:hypothetical protein
LLKSRCPDAAIVTRKRGADAVISKSTPAVDLPDVLLEALARKRAAG